MGGEEAATERAQWDESVLGNRGPGEGFPESFISGHLKAVNHSGR